MDIFNDFIYLAIAFSIILISILYVFSKLFKQLENYFINELSELWVNLGILFAMGGIVTLSNAFMQYILVSLGMSPTVDMFNWLQLQLSQLQVNVGKEMSFFMLVGQAAKIYENSRYTTGYPGAKSVSGQVYPGIGLFVNAIFTVNGLLLIVMGSLVIQQMLLDLIKYLAFGFFLPLGVLLRFIPGVRPFGSELVALAIAFGIVLPIVYFLMYASMYDLGLQRGGYYKDFVIKNMPQLIDGFVNPTQIGKNASTDTLSLDYVDMFSNVNDEDFNSAKDTFSDFLDWLKSFMLVAGYAAFYVVNLPIYAVLLFYKLIEVGGYIVYAVAIPSFSITFAIVTIKSIKDFIHNL